MTTIVFVDTDRAALAYLELALCTSDKNWDLHFFDCANEAMGFLCGTDVDCIVSDMHMHDSCDDQLLGQVAIRFPHVIRIAVSAWVDAEMTLESLHATHRFIAKPAEAHIIIEAIQRSLDLWTRLDSAELKETIAGITALPVLPEIYDRLITEIASVDHTTASIGWIIESDIGLSAALLKVVNSPYYGLVQHVQSPAHAAQLLGVELVKNILLYENVLSQFRISPARKAFVSELNTSARIRGLLASQFSKLANLSHRQMDHCQIAGMMSNLGELVIEAGLLADTPDTNLTPSMGADIDADLIGGSIIGLWSLPDPVVEAVLLQRDEQEPSGSLGVAHVIHAIRQFERAWMLNGKRIDQNLTVQSALPESAIDPNLLAKWLDCFCDYHSLQSKAA